MTNSFVNSNNEEILTPEELAKKLKVGLNWVYIRSMHRRKNGFPVIKCGGRLIRFRLSEVLRWIEENQDQD